MIIEGDIVGHLIAELLTAQGRSIEFDQTTTDLCTRAHRLEHVHVKEDTPFFCSAVRRDSAFWQKRTDILTTAIIGDDPEGRLTDREIELAAI